MNLIGKIKLFPNAILGYERSDPFRNGEYRFLREYIKPGMVIIDAGANTGEYSQYMLSISSNIKIHCFEPERNTFSALTNRLQREIMKNLVKCNNVGLSNKETEEEIIIYDELDGRNSLHFNPLHSFDRSKLRKEKVKLIILNDYTINNNIKFIDFLKIDVEGHESKVIEGAGNLIYSKSIRCIQFEYNNNWLAAGSKLEDVFNYLSDNGFRLFRLTIWGKIPIRQSSKKLENYKHANYVALLNEG